MLMKKFCSLNFVVVMKSCNVYIDFIMDILVEFGKKLWLFVMEVKVMLVCDEVFMMCKVIWIGINFEKFKLDVEVWMEFLCFYFLEEGDVCVFEIFNWVIICIGIYIFCVVGLRWFLFFGYWI